MRYCDIHTHILPEMDDGSKSVLESIRLIESLNRFGIDAIAFTPHYYSNKESIDDFLERRGKSLDLIKESLPKNLKYTLGAEVFITDLFFGNEDVSKLCYLGTNFMLTEFSYDITPERAENIIEHIRVSQFYCLSPYILLLGD